MVTRATRPLGSPAEHGPDPSRESFFSSSFFCKKMSEFVLPARSLGALLLMGMRNHLPAQQGEVWPIAYVIPNQQGKWTAEIFHQLPSLCVSWGYTAYWMATGNKKVFAAFPKEGITQYGRQQAWTGSAGEPGSPLSSSNKRKCFRKLGTLIPLFLWASLTYPISSLCDNILEHKCAFTVQPATKEEQH